ncbi:MAG: HEAT repeat domain-containing protein [Planctomycetes bacterium]|nr:HEAT repeat domain-containing protein [Planctomycetota bacterium]
MKPTTFWPLVVVIAGAALGAAIIILRREPPAPLPKPAVEEPNPRPTPPLPPPLAAPPASSDPLMNQWRMAIRQHDEKGVLGAQAGFLAREWEYREPLMKMAKEEADPRIRAFSLAVLGRMKATPPEAFFIERLDDASEHPRVSALQALEKIGTSACLSKVDSLAFSDYSKAVEAAALRTAKVVRSR